MSRNLTNIAFLRAWLRLAHQLQYRSKQAIKIRKARYGVMRAGCENTPAGMPISGQQREQ
ncbi:MAG: hypothetical protein ACC707_19450 [Thiohalomonadales bacterium]